MQGRGEGFGGAGPFRETLFLRSGPFVFLSFLLGFICPLPFGNFGSFALPKQERDYFQSRRFVFIIITSLEKKKFTFRKAVEFQGKCGLIRLTLS